MPNPNLPISGQYNTYIGARYIPKFADPIEWDSTVQYEPMTIVTYQGNSYTSRTYVPVGVPTSNITYWAPTGNYNAQVEQYRQEVNNYTQQLQPLINNAHFVTPEQYGAVGDGITDDSAAITEASQHGTLIGGIGKNYSIQNDAYVYGNSLYLNFTINDGKVIRFPTSNTLHFNNTFNVPLEQIKNHQGRGTFCTRTSNDGVTFLSCKWLRGTNLLALNSSSNTKIINCTFMRAYQTAFDEGGNGYGIFIVDGCQNITISQCTFISIGRHSIYLSKDDLSPVSNKNIIIQNCIFDWSNINNEELPVQGLGTDVSINVRYTIGLTVDCCQFLSVDNAINLIPNPDDMLSDIIITNNKINSIATSYYAIGESAYNGYSATNVLVENNVISCISPAMTVFNGKISGNIFRSENDAIVVYTANPNDECEIINNQFYTGNGISTASNNNIMKKLSIRGNLFKCTSSIGFRSRGGNIEIVEIIENYFDSVTYATNQPLVSNTTRYAINGYSGTTKLLPVTTATNPSHAFDDAFNFSS